jgi:hypothetical protein
VVVDGQGLFPSATQRAFDELSAATKRASLCSWLLPPSDSPVVLIFTCCPTKGVPDYSKGQNPSSTGLALSAKRAMMRALSQHAWH